MTDKPHPQFGALDHGPQHTIPTPHVPAPSPACEQQLKTSTRFLGHSRSHSEATHLQWTPQHTGRRLQHGGSADSQQSLVPCSPLGQGRGSLSHMLEHTPQENVQSSSFTSGSYHTHSSGLHFRSCGPACTAAKPFTHMLDSAVAKASNRNYRDGYDHCIACGGFVSAGHVVDKNPARPHLQSRRSNIRTDGSGLPNPAHLPDSTLHINRKEWEQTPPLPSVERAHGSDTKGLFDTGPSMTSLASIVSISSLTSTDPFLSSPPEVIAIAQPCGRPREESDKSTDERTASNVMSMSMTAVNHRVHPVSEISLRKALFTEPVGAAPLNRFHTIHGDRPDLVVRKGLGDPLELLGNPEELRGFVSPEQHALISERYRQLTNRGANRTSEERMSCNRDWSLDTAIAFILRDIVAGLSQAIGRKRVYRIMEYGRSVDTPNKSILEVIQALHQLSPESKILVAHQCVPPLTARVMQTSPELYLSQLLFSQNTSRIVSNFCFSELLDSAFVDAEIDFTLCGGALSRVHSPWSECQRHSSLVEASQRDDLADRDLCQFLQIRAEEIRSGGFLVLHFAVRTCLREPRSIQSPLVGSPSTWSKSLPTSPRASLDSQILTDRLAPLIAVVPQPYPPLANGNKRDYRPDIFQRMCKALAPGLQHLVTVGEIRNWVAPMMLDTPFWPRTLEGVKESLSKQKEWDILRDVNGASTVDPRTHQEYSAEERQEWLNAGVALHRLTHPAWRDFQKGTIDHATYARRVTTYCEAVYESHFKQVLRDKGKMDLNQAETTIKTLIDLLKAKCELGWLNNLECDIGIVVLKRR